MKKLALLAITALAGTVLATATAGVANAAVVREIPISTFIDQPQGSTVTLGTFPSEGAAGLTCTVTSRGVNQESVHVNNNLHASSGGGSVTMLDVEGTPNKVSTAAGTLTMGSSVTLSVTIGNQDSGQESDGTWYGFFSGGMNVEFDCTPGPPPPPPTDISLCHANSDGSYTLEGPFTEAEAQQLHGGHPGDITPAPEGGCPPPPPPPEEISLCHSNGDGTYTLEGPFSEAEAQQLHGGHAGDITPAPAGGCPAPPPPEQVTLCHSNGDGTFETVGPISPAEAASHDGHVGDINPAPEGGCEGPTVRAVEVSLCHTNADDTYSLEGPMSEADAQSLHGSHAADIIPAPAAGCPEAAEVAVGAIAPVCIADIPFIEYSITNNFGAATVDLTFTDVNGDVVAEYPAAPLSGTVIYPGASANPEDWPGWRLAENGNWEPDPADAHLREGLLVTATINPSGSALVAYPPSTEACNGPNQASGSTSQGGGGDASSDAPSGGLPVTGSGNTVAMVLAALALLAGGFFLVRTARTPEPTQD